MEVNPSSLVEGVYDYYSKDIEVKFSANELYTNRIDYEVLYKGKQIDRGEIESDVGEDRLPMPIRIEQVLDRREELIFWAYINGEALA